MKNMMNFIKKVNYKNMMNFINNKNKQIKKGNYKKINLLIYLKLKNRKKY